MGSLELSHAKKFRRYDPNEAEPVFDPPFRVAMHIVVDDQTRGQVVMEIFPKWAPLGAERLLALVKEKYYDGNRFFRVEPGFVVQWGINGELARSAKWHGRDLVDEDIEEYDFEKNLRGTVSFAVIDEMKHTRCTQLFVNMKDNEDLDYDEIFPPVGRVIQGMDLLEQLNAEYMDLKGDSLLKQGHIHTKGQRYLDEQFPELSYIETARVLDPAEWKDIEEVAADAGLVKKSGTQEKKEKTEETEEEEENAKVEL